jgi:DNA-binding HxlR family transcriptional regulator
VTEFRYPQCCALARAAEILCDRWTLLVIRELLLGPKRFSDLRVRLSGVSPSVLSARLVRLEEHGVVARSELEPPAASRVYELTATGQALAPAVNELSRWGMRFLFPPRRDDQLEPDWLAYALALCARRTPTPDVTIELRMLGGKRDTIVRIEGGQSGTHIGGPSAEPADVIVGGTAIDVFSALSGSTPVAEAVASQRIHIEGDVAHLARLPELLNVNVTAAALGPGAT